MPIRSVRSTFAIAAGRRSIVRGAALLSASLLMLAGIGTGACGRDTPAVVAYVAVDEHAAKPVLALFEQLTGIRVRAVFDTEITKTTGLVQRLRRERASPRADLFWSNESIQSSALAREGVLEGGEAGLRPTMIRARVVVYDASKVEADELPSSWWDLADDRFRDRIAMADPRFGTTAAHLAAMHAHCVERGVPERFDAWCRGLGANRVRVLTSGNSGVVRAVAAGEVDFGMTDTDDVAAINLTILPRSLSMAVLRHGDGPGEGPMLIPGFAGVVAGARQPELAARLLDFLASEEAQRTLAVAAPGFHALADAPALGMLDGLLVDPGIATASLPSAIERFFDAVAPDR